jgi:hypothetical protein
MGSAPLTLRGRGTAVAELQVAISAAFMATASRGMKNGQTNRRQFSHLFAVFEVFSISLRCFSTVE